MKKIIPKVELSSYDGIEPREWIRKCLKNFQVCDVSREKMVEMASLCLVDRTDAWFNNRNRGNQNPSWEQFEEALGKRFRDLRVEDIVEEEALWKRFRDLGVEDTVEEFMRLMQEGSIEKYQDRLENIRVRMERVLPELGESYFLSGFIEGLRDEIKPMVKMLRHIDLTHAIEEARLQEMLLLSTSKGPYTTKTPYSQTKPITNNYNSFKTSQLHKNFPYVTKPPNDSISVNKTTIAIPKPANSNQSSSITQLATKSNQPTSNLSMRVPSLVSVVEKSTYVATNVSQVCYVITG